MRIEVAAVAAVLLAGLAAPLPGRAGGEDAAAPCSHELAYEPFQGLVLLPISIAGSPPLDFVLDSGSTVSTLLDRELAAALGLAPSGVGLARGLGRGATEVQVVRGVRLSAEGEALLEADLVVHHLQPRLGGASGRDIHGLLGWDLFARYAVEVDPGQRRVLLHDPRAATDRLGLAALPMEVVRGRPVVRAEVTTGEGRAVAVDLMVDTGSASALVVIQGSHRHLRPGPGAERRLAQGIGGEVPAVAGQLAALRLGPIVVHDVPVSYVARASIPAAVSLPDLHGVLGNAVLSRFRVIVDGPGRRLLVGPLSAAAGAGSGPAPRPPGAGAERRSR